MALGRVEMAEKRMLAISGRRMYMTPGTKSNTRHLSRFRSCILCYAMMLCYAMLCYAMLCDAMLFDATLCYAMLCDARYTRAHERSVIATVCMRAVSDRHFATNRDFSEDRKH